MTTAATRNQKEEAMTTAVTPNPFAGVKIAPSATQAWPAAERVGRPRAERDTTFDALVIAAAKDGTIFEFDCQHAEQARKLMGAIRAAAEVLTATDAMPDGRQVQFRTTRFEEEVKDGKTLKHPLAGAWRIADYARTVRAAKSSED